MTTPIEYDSKTHSHTRLSHFPIQQVTENLCYLPPFLQYTNTRRGYENEWKNLRKDKYIPTEKTC